MFPILFILFTALPALELYVLIKVGVRIGALNTIFLLIITGAIGAWLARLQGFIIIEKINTSLARGLMPSEELLDGALVLAGGILLLTPGFITDIFGLILLIPLTRVLIKILFKAKLKSMMENGQIISVNRSSGPKRYKDIDI